ncbi:hypothetical protein ACHAWF_010394 [Thalassiosira exigua]
MSNTNTSDSNAAMEDPWEPGLRRRRGRNSERDEDDDGVRDGESTRGNDDSGRTGTTNGANGEGERSVPAASAPRPTNGAPGPIGFGRSSVNFGVGGEPLAGAPPCGGGGAVGVMTSPVAAPRGTLGGAPPSTPHKPPAKDSDLVAVTPSSITTAGETADSTLATNSPLRLSVRRRRSSRRPSASVPDLRRRYHLLRAQIFLLLGSAVVGLFLFLFYALPLAAFVSLALLASSTGALVPVAQSALRARYELEMEHPLGLTRYLPAYLREMLTETTLHEFMTDDRFFMEYRYLLLYFMPGLRPEQLADFIDQLPARHREALLQPGLGRMMPSVMGNLMRLDDIHEEPANPDAPLLDNGDIASTGSGLTIEGENHREGREVDEADTQVSLLDAIVGLPRTLAGFALENARTAGGDGGSAAHEGIPLGPPVAIQSQTPPATNAALGNNQAYSDGQDDADDSSNDGSSIEFSVDLDAHGLTDMLGDANANEVRAAPTARELSHVVVEVTQPSDGADANEESDSQQEEAQRQEYDLEGTILTQAASAAVANYAAQATEVARDRARDTASEAMEATSSVVVRAGVITGLISGGGGIVASVVANHQGGSSLFVSLGAFARLRNNGNPPSPRGLDGSIGSSDAVVSERERGFTSSQWINGLFITSATSFVSAGFAYLIRNHVRASIAARRERRLMDATDEDDDGTKNP